MIEIHAFIADNGHNLSTDCWCEPAAIHRSKLKDGVTPCLIVEHNDEHGVHHLDVVAERLKRIDDEYTPGSEGAWITRNLNNLKQHSTDEGE